MKKRFPLLIGLVFALCLMLGSIPNAIAASNDPKLSSVEIGGQKATISESSKTVTVTLKSSVDLSKVKITFSTSPKNSEVFLTKSKDNFDNMKTIKSGNSYNLNTYSVINVSVGAPEGGAYEAQYTIKIKTEKKVPVKSIKATTSTKVSVKVKKTTTCKVSVSPSDATDKTIKWSSSSTKIATVSSKGVVTGVKKGTCTVTATASNGSKVKFTITVK